MANWNPFMTPHYTPPVPDNNCLVTMLYDLASKEPNTKRCTIYQYIKDAEALFKLNQYIIFFVETEELKAKVRHRRDIFLDDSQKVNLLEKTWVVVKPFPLLRYYDELANINECDKTHPISNMNPTGVRHMGKNSNHYRIIGWNKCECLKEAISLNPFKSKRWAWIDFGIGTRVNIPTNIDTIIGNIGDKVKFGLFNHLQNYGVDREDFYASEKRMLVGGFFAGRTDYMLKFIELFEKELDRLLKKHRYYRPLEDAIFARVIHQNYESFKVFWTFCSEQIFERWI